MTCHTNGSVLDWSVIVPQFVEGTTRRIYATAPDNTTELVYIGGVPFQFSKTSWTNLSLMSAVVVDGANVTSELNGTIVKCTRPSEPVITTTILVIGNGTYTLQCCPWGTKT